MTDYTKQLVEQRRELHQWPEEGWTEFWTTNYIVNKLRSWGYEVLLGTKIINPDRYSAVTENSFRKAIRTPWPAEFLSLSLTKPKATLAALLCSTQAKKARQLHSVSISDAFA